MALWGLDAFWQYAALLAAVDARERADIERARVMVSADVSIDRDFGTT